MAYNTMKRKLFASALIVTQSCDNEVDGLKFAVSFGDDGVARSDIGSDEFTASLGLLGYDSAFGIRRPRLPAAGFHPFFEFVLAGTSADEEGLAECEKIGT